LGQQGRAMRSRLLLAMRGFLPRSSHSTRVLKRFKAGGLDQGGQPRAKRVRRSGE
jgi:hypothetical protein